MGSGQSPGGKTHFWHIFPERIWTQQYFHTGMAVGQKEVAV